MNSLENRNRVMELETKLKDTFEQIGKKFYEENRTNSTIDDIYQELFAAVKKIYDEKDIIERKNLAVKGMRRCEACHHIVTIDSIFCNKCGMKLSELSKDILQEDIVDTRSCSGCGAKLEPGALFCTNCGKRR